MLVVTPVAAMTALYYIFRVEYPPPAPLTTRWNDGKPFKITRYRLVDRIEWPRFTGLLFLGGSLIRVYLDL